MESKIPRMTLTLLLIGMITLAFNIQTVKASGTIYIKADGSVDPPGAPISTVDSVTYTFIGNIFDEVVIERSDIVVDGDGYTLQGSGSGTGFRLAGISNVTITRTDIKGFYHAIHLESSFSNVISGNNMTLNFVAVYLWSSSFNKITRNNMTDIIDYGVQLLSSSNNTISGNDISSAAGLDGIRFSSNSSNNTVIGNSIANYLNGFSLYSSSSDNRIFHNNFLNNIVQVNTVNSVNSLDDGYPSGGNYWSDYAGVDADGDGIGDTPYIIDASNQDNYPLMNLVSPIVGDVNADGIVDIFDIGYISAHWYPGPPVGPLGYDVYADINNDLAVDIFDIGIVSAHWGESW